MRNLYCVVMLLCAFNCFGQEREIAITIDDLPLVASKMDTPANQQRAMERFTSIVQAFAENKVPATGFVIAGSIGKGQMAFLQQFLDAGLSLGNHTYSHYNLNQKSADKYIADIDRADKILSPLLTTPKYFRYPYLAEGNKTTKPLVQEYLAAHQYTIAPVTIDSKDFAFNEQLYKIPFRSRVAYIEKFKSRYLAFIWKQTLLAEKRANGKPVKQILLIHANLLNSYLLKDVIQMYKDNGYTFISLAQALENPAPTITAPDVPTNEKTVINKIVSSVIPEEHTAGVQ